MSQKKTKPFLHYNGLSHLQRSLPSFFSFGYLQSPSVHVLHTPSWCLTLPQIYQPCISAALTNARSTVAHASKATAPPHATTSADRCGPCVQQAGRTRPASTGRATCVCVRITFPSPGSRPLYRGSRSARVKDQVMGGRSASVVEAAVLRRQLRQPRRKRTRRSPSFTRTSSQGAYRSRPSR